MTANTSYWICRTADWLGVECDTDADDLIDSVRRAVRREIRSQGPVGHRYDRLVRFLHTLNAI